MRARDWGVPDYVKFRTEVCELSSVTTWDDLIDHDDDVRKILSNVYK